MTGKVWIEKIIKLLKKKPANIRLYLQQDTGTLIFVDKQIGQEIGTFSGIESGVCGFEECFKLYDDGKEK